MHDGKNWCLTTHQKTGAWITEHESHPIESVTQLSKIEGAFSQRVSQPVVSLHGVLERRAPHAFSLVALEKAYTRAKFLCGKEVRRANPSHRSNNNGEWARG